MVFQYWSRWERQGREHINKCQERLVFGKSGRVPRGPEEVADLERMVR